MIIVAHKSRQDVPAVGGLRCISEMIGGYFLR